MTSAEMEPEVTPAESPQEPEEAAALDREPEAPPAAPVPWEDPELSRLRGMGRTLKQVLFYPKDFYQGLSREGWGEALAFGLIVGTLGMLASLYWQLFFYLGFSRTLSSAPGLTRLFVMGSGAIMAMMFLTPLIVLGHLLLSSLGLWVAVGLTGGPWRGFTAAWRIICYAQGAMLAGVVPLLGGPLAGLWGFFLTYRGLRGVFALSFWRSLGVLILSVLLQTLLVLLLLGSVLGLRLLRG